MNENNVVKFMNITDCDRRTACFCLNEYNGNMDLALSFYYDVFLANNAKVPEKFSLEDFEKQYGLSSSTIPNKATQEIKTPTESIFERKYPIEDEIVVPEFLHRKKPVTPEVFFPNPQIPHVIKEQGPVLINDEACNINLMMKNTYTIDTSYLPHVLITIWANGITINEHFIANNSDNYNEMYNEIINGKIPSLIDAKTSDVELINNHTEDYRVKSQ